MVALSTDASGNQYLNDLNASTGAEVFPCTSSDWRPFFTAKSGWTNGTHWKWDDSNQYAVNFALRFPAPGIETKTGALTDSGSNLARVKWGRDRWDGSGDAQIIYTGNSTANTQKSYPRGTDRTSSGTEVTFAILNDYALSYCCFSDASLTTLVNWSYIGWLNKPQRTGNIYPQGFVWLDSARNVFLRVKAQNIDYSYGDGNSVIGNTISTANNAITNPTFTCETGFTCPVTTPEAASIIIRDDASPNQPVGELYNHIDVPSSYTNGKVVFDQNSQAYIVCGAWGGAKKAMKIKATGYALPS